MSERQTKILVIGEIGVITNLRQQIVNLAKRKHSNVEKLSKKLGVTRQYTYWLLNQETIDEHNLVNILKAIGATTNDLKVSKPGS